MKTKFSTWIFLSVLTAACCQGVIPKSQDVDGNCALRFVDSYNKVQNSSFSPQGETQSSSVELAENCKLILAAYGPKSESCKATNLKTGEAQQLSTADVRESCARSIPNNYFATDSE